MILTYKLRCVFFALLCFGIQGAWGQITTFTYTGGPESYVVPASVTMISIEASGAQGGDGNGGAGGLGATMYGEFTVTPGDVLEVIVGEAGMQYGNSGGGGGGSGVVFMGAPMIVAGGGGGGSIYDPGYGGVITEDGGSSSGPGGTGGNGGQKGYQPSDCGWASGGGGFYGDGYGGNGDWDGGSLPGTLGGAGAGRSYVSGGAGGVNGGCTFTFPNEGAYGCGGGGAGSYGGAGGGGYSGGGGGQYVDGGGVANRPGGGGGSYNDGTEQINTPDNHTGNGQIIITVLCNALTVTISDDEVCFGEEVTLDAESEEGAEILWDMGVIDGEPFVPAETGVITYTATSEDDGDCELTVDITVYELPIVVAGAGDENFCIDEPVVLSAGGNADNYTWDPTDLEPGLGTHTYLLTGESEGTGCISMDEVEITVHDLPTISASVDMETVCVGIEVTVTGAGGVTYDWTPGDIVDGEAFLPGDPGTYEYTVVGTDENECQNESSVEVTVVEDITITYTILDEMMGYDGEIDITVTGGAPPYSFDWDTDETGDFDDDEDLTGLSDGSYTVVVNGSAGCTSEVMIYLGSQLSVEESILNNVSVYPNPTVSDVTIALAGEFVFEITTVDGALLMRGIAVDQEIVSLEQFAAGTYFLNVSANGETGTLRLVKQ